MEMFQRTGPFFPTIVLRPHWLQYVVDQFPWLLVWLMIMGVAGLEGMCYVHQIKAVGICLFMYLLYRYIYFSSIQFKITSEQLIYRHGIIRHLSDYTELYRIVDYQENRILMQLFFGLKTVILTTSDRSTPVIKIIGVSNRDKIIEEIRSRVEYNRRRKGIYEFTNQF